MVNFLVADSVCNIFKICFVLRLVKQYLTDVATILASNALVSSHLGYCKFFFGSRSSFNMGEFHTF